MTVMRKVSAFCGRIKNGSVDTRRSVKSKHQKDNEVGFNCWYFLVFLLNMHNILKNFYKLHGYERKKKQCECLIEGVFNKL